MFFYSYFYISFNVQSNLGFLKVLVVKLPSEVLQLHTKSMVENLLSSQVYCETSLKAKVVALITKFWLIVYWFMPNSLCSLVMYLPIPCQTWLTPFFVFTFQVKLLLEMVVNKCGLHNIRAVMPGEQMEVLAKIHKVRVRNILLVWGIWLVFNTHLWSWFFSLKADNGRTRKEDSGLQIYERKITYVQSIYIQV